MTRECLHDEQLGGGKGRRERRRQATNRSQHIEGEGGAVWAQGEGGGSVYLDAEMASLVKY